MQGKICMHFLEIVCEDVVFKFYKNLLKNTHKPSQRQIGSLVNIVTFHAIDFRYMNKNQWRNRVEKCGLASSVALAGEGATLFKRAPVAFFYRFKCSAYFHTLVRFIYNTIFLY